MLKQGQALMNKYIENSEIRKNKNIMEVRYGISDNE